jgi:hypothetical protein
MSRTTPNLGLYIPVQGEHYGTHIDDNFDALDLASGGIGAPDAKLQSPVLAGDTSLTVTGVAPSTMFNNKGAALLVGAGSGAEAIRVASVSGHTFTLDNAAQGPNGFCLPHSAGDPVYVLRDETIYPWFLGAKVNSATNDANAVQAAILCALRYGLTLRGTGTGDHSHAIAQGTFWPDIEFEDLFLAASGFPAGSIYLDPNRDLTLKDDSTYAMRGARQAYPIISADPTTDRLTFSASFISSLDTFSPIGFSTPFGETLPGGIIAGRPYWIYDSPTSNTIRIATTAALTAPLDITSAGSGPGNDVGWVHGNWHSTMRWRINQNVRLDVGDVDLCGAYLDAQQPAYINSLRVTMNADATVSDRAIGFFLYGQLGNLYNCEFDPDSANVIGWVLGGALFTHAGKVFFQHGVGKIAKSAVVSGFGHKWDGFESESVDAAGYNIYLPGTGANASVQGCDFGDPFCGSGNPTVPHIYDATGNNASYRVGQMVFPTASYAILHATRDGGVNLTSSDGATPGVGVGDPLNHQFHGYRQIQGGGIMFEAVYDVVVAVNFTQRLDVRNYLVDTTAGNIVPTLLSPAITRGEVTFKNYKGANNVVITAPGGSHVDGSSTKTLTPGQSARISGADGNDWWSV